VQCNVKDVALPCRCGVPVAE